MQVFVGVEQIKRWGSKTRNKAVRQHALASWRKKQKRESECTQTAHVF